MTEITDEQVEAVRWLQRKLTEPITITEGRHIRTLLAALPIRLANAQLALPTQKGVYMATGGLVVTLDEYGWDIDAPERYTPMVRLVREGTQITRAQVEEAIHEAEVSGAKGGKYVEALHLSLLGQMED